MAAKFWVGNASFLGLSDNWNYNTAGITNWGSASGVIDNVAPPTVVDAVTFDGGGLYGNQNSTISATISCLSLTITAGYTATMTHNAILTIAGSWTTHSGFTIAGSSIISFSANGTWTSGGKTWPNGLKVTGASTVHTISGDLVILGTFNISGTNTVINKTTTETFSAAGFNNSSGSANTSTGTITLILTGGSWTCTSASVRSSFPINIQGDVTIGTIVGISNTTLTYISGTVITTGSSLSLQLAMSVNTSGIIWNAIQTSFLSTVITLTSDLACVSFTANSNNITLNKTGSETLTCSGGLGVNDAIFGTAKIILTGGTWSGSSTTGVSNNLDIQGNVTISGNVYKNGGTITYVSGTPVVTSSTLNLVTSCNLDTAGMTWNNVTLSNTTALTYTINSSLNASLLTFGTGASTIFAGTAGFTVDTLSHPSTVGGNTVTLKESITYTITAAFNCNTTRVGSTVLFTSAHGTTRANILMPNNGSNLCNVLANFTRIDASAGRSINVFGGTITDCININQYYDYKGVAA